MNNMHIINVRYLVYHIHKHVKYLNIYIYIYDWTERFTSTENPRSNLGQASKYAIYGHLSQANRYTGDGEPPGIYQTLSLGKCINKYVLKMYENYIVEGSEIYDRSFWLKRIIIDRFQKCMKRHLEHARHKHICMYSR